MDSQDWKAIHGFTMPSIDIQTLATAAVVAGLGSHWLYFIRGEHHMSAPILFNLYLSFAAIAFFYEIYIGTCTTYSCAAQNVALVVGSYTTSLFTSIIIYRVLFHPLRSFPGPYLARVSKFWHVYHVRHSQNHLLLENMYQKYGPFIRTGPTEITIITQDAMSVVDGPGSNCTKADWYDLILPLRPMINMRNKADHDARRRIWDKGFGVKAMRSYESRIITYGNQLEKHLAITSGQPVCVNDWFHFFSFDVMGDLAFAKSFDMLVNEEWHYSVILMREFMSYLGPFGPVPWLCRIGFNLPGLAPGWTRFLDYCKAQFTERIETEPTKSDISSHLIEASKRNNSLAQDADLLNGDALSIIVAGSDTTGSTITLVFYHLAKHPAYQEQIREELKAVSSLSDIQSLQALVGLRSFVAEVLRLFPPVPTGGNRMTPKEGITVTGRYIPPHTTVSTPRYSISRLDAAFEHPLDFIPERWTSRPELIRDKRAYAPFSQGRSSCIGQTLAMKEISYVVALIVSKYDVAFAPGEDGVRVWQDLKDKFTQSPGRLELVFRLREGESPKS